MAIPTKPIEANTEKEIFGSANDDYLLGTSGDDIIYGAVDFTNGFFTDGVDTMQGGAGDDQYIVNTLISTTVGSVTTVATDTVIEFDGEGVDTVFASVNYTLPAFVENIVATGAAAVTLTGNSVANILDGSQSTQADTLKGMEGNDTYIIGSGDKIIEGKAGTGTTVTYSDPGGIDTIISKIAATTVNISSTALGQVDTALGGAPITTTVRTVAAGPIVGAAFIENVTLDDAATTSGILGNIKDNRLTGNASANTLTGNEGNDTLDGGKNTSGGDTLIGGKGNDTYIVRNATDVVTETFTNALGGGIDTLISALGVNMSTAAFANIDNITLTGIGDVNATGNGNLANTIKGNSGNNVLKGGVDTIVSGVQLKIADTLYGLQGDDTLDGGFGNDIMAGGRGNDTYIVDSTGDVVTEVSLGTVTLAGNDLLNGTADFVKSSVTYALTGTALGVEKLTLTGALNINATGNAKDNILIGNSVDNILNGGTGADDLQGKGGKDTYIVDNASDKVIDTAGTDTIQSSVDFNLGAGTLTTTTGSNTGVENLTLTGTTAINATGNGSNNIIIGNSIGNNINGGTGADNMQGMAGDDTYIVDDIGDKVTDSSGTDSITTSVTFNLATAGSGVENITLSAGAFDLTGNSLNNTITGSSEANSIDGGAGNDIITGGAGQDTVTTGAGTDTVKFAAEVADTVATATSISGVDVYNDLVLNLALGDKIDLTVIVAAIGTAVSGSVTESDFITDMNALLTATGAGFVTTAAGIDAAVVTADAGGLDGRTFLAVDLDASGAFTVSDFVIEITGSTVTSLTTASFV